MPRLSVIVPVLNEEAAIIGCLESLREPPELEVLVVDGGSSDRTRERAMEAGVGRLLQSPTAGRAAQMNHAAGEAAGEILLFLHADTRLPEGWVDEVCGAVAGGAVGGRFRLGFDDSSPAFRLIGIMSTWRSRFLGITYGDQAIFATRSAFDGVGGFPERRIFEDSEFSDAISTFGRFDLLNEAVITSARRWRERGPLRTVLRMWCLRILYTLGLPDQTLSQWYADVR